MAVLGIAHSADNNKRDKLGQHRASKSFNNLSTVTVEKTLVGCMVTCLHRSLRGNRCSTWRWRWCRGGCHLMWCQCLTCVKPFVTTQVKTGGCHTLLINAFGEQATFLPSASLSSPCLQHNQRMNCGYSSLKVQPTYLTILPSALPHG